VILVSMMASMILRSTARRRSATTMVAGILESMRVVRPVMMMASGTLESTPARSKEVFGYSIVSFGV
jgi:hypothetical protein